VLRTPFLVVLAVFGTWALVHRQCARTPDLESAYLAADYAEVIKTEHAGHPHPLEALLVGLSYVAQQRYAEARMYFARLPGPDGTAYAVVRGCGLLEIEVRSGRYDDAAPFAEACHRALLALPSGPSEIAGYGWHSLGYHDHASARYVRSLERYAQALDVLPASGRMSAYLALNTRNNMGNVYYRTGRSTEALRMHQHVHAERVALLGPEHPKTGGSIGNLGNVYHSIGEHEKALYFHQRAAEIWRRTAGEFDPEYAYSLNNIGLALMRLDRHAEATNVLNQALAIKKAVFGDSSATLINTVANLTATYMRLDSLDQSRDMAHETLHIAGRHGLVNTPGLWSFEADRAALLMQSGRQAAAAEVLERAYESSRLAGHPVSFRLANALARYHIDNREPDRALPLLQWVDECVRHCPWSPVSDSTLATDPPVEESIREWLEANRLWLAIPSATSMDRIALAASTAERLQSGSWSLKFDRLWYNTALALYKGMTDRAIVDGHVALAWHAVEARKGLFVRRVARNQEAVVPTLEQLINVESALAAAESSARSRDDDVAQLIAERVRMQLEFERSRSLHEDAEPRTAQAMSSGHDDTRIATMEWARRTGGSYVNYFVGGSPSSVHALVVTADSSRLVTLGPEPEVTTVVDSLRRALQSGTRAVKEHAARRAGAMLLTPIQQLLGDGPIVVSPDEGLYDIPFEVLTVGGPAHQLTYLVERKTVSYAHTSAAWLDTPVFARDGTLRATVLDVTFPDPTMPALPGVSSQRGPESIHAGLRRSPLPGVRTETDALRDVLGRSGRTDTRYIRDATEGMFAREAARPTDILHVATHSYFNSTTPHDSGILFARSRTGMTDGVLRPAELARLDIPTGLLVLSSCSTARRTGGLSAAFDFGIAMGLSGASRALVSNWPVDDVATTEFMVRFYAYIVAGDDPETALAHTKVSFLREASPLADPAIWSAFVLIAI